MSVNINGIYYHLNNNDDEAEVTSYNEEKYYGDVIIPDKFLYNGKTYRVTKIGDWAFEDCRGLTSITIPDSITKIGDGAFLGCSGLTSVTIPDSITKIGKVAFRDCIGLTSISIPNSVTEIGVGAFYGCSGLTSITIHSSVKEIGGSVFSGCWVLTSITIPNSVTEIGDSAFSRCSGLTSITIPNSVTKIGDWAFCGCSGLTSITIPDSVTEIGYQAFSDCSGLTSITIPDSVTEIGYQAFSDCSGLTNITIPNSVTEIGEGAFHGCSGLTSITIPNSVTEIEKSAFYCCRNLTHLTLNGTGKSFLVTDEIRPRIKKLIVGTEIKEIENLDISPNEIYCYNPIPPACYAWTFANRDAVLHVPKDAVVSYMTAKVWKEFGNIVNDIEEFVTLDQTNASLNVGQKLKLLTTAHRASEKIEWSSSNPSVARVDENGMVTATSGGVCRIYATLEAQPAAYASCLVEVTDGLWLDCEETTISVHEMLTITPHLPQDANLELNADSNNPEVAFARMATVGGQQVVQVVGLKSGTATVTVSAAGDDAIPATCKITVK